MDDPINIRIRGIMTVVFGAMVTIGFLWLGWVLQIFPYHLLAVGPLIAAYGIGALILGERVFGVAEGLRKRLYRWAFAAVGGLSGLVLAEAVAHGAFSLLDSHRQAALEFAGMPEQIVTREELDTAVQEVTARAAGLQKLRATLNTNDATAVQQFDRDVAAYTQRNQEVAELKIKYEARLAAEALLKARLMGTWKYAFAVSDDDDDTATNISVYTTYTPDGRARIEKAAYADGQTLRAHADAHWELTGKRLRVTTDTAGKTSGERPGHTREFVLREIFDGEMHCRDVTAGTEVVCQRVSL